MILKHINFTLDKGQTLGVVGRTGSGKSTLLKQLLHEYPTGTGEILISDVSMDSPFYGAPFTLNLFNFDPSMEYGPENISIIHPFINFLTSPLVTMIGGVNLPYLLIQSILNAFSAALVYYIIRRSGAGWTLSLVTAAFFGISSYSLFTTLIPDSYAYAQFMIILSAAYLHYCRMENLW